MKMGKNLIPEMKMRMKKIGQMNLIFEFSRSKLLFILFSDFHENLRKKKTDPFFKNNRGKNEDVNEKVWKNEFDL